MAHRALGGERPRPRGPRARSTAPGPTTSGMTSPALRTMTVSPGRTSLAAHLVLVVQGGHADGGAADEHRLEHGEGRGLAGAADRHLDARAAAWCAPRAGTCRRWPSGAPWTWSRAVAAGEVVDLHHHAVDLVGEVVAVLLPVAAVVVHLLEGVEDRAARGSPGSPASPATPASRRGSAKVGPALDLGELVGPEAQAPAGGDRRVLLAQRAGRGVAGVGVDAAARPPPGRSLSASKAASGHVHLAPHLEQVGARPSGSRSGTSAIVRRLAVTSSPTRPSPRVAPQREAAPS